LSANAHSTAEFRESLRFTISAERICYLGFGLILAHLREPLRYDVLTRGQLIGKARQLSVYKVLERITSDHGFLGQYILNPTGLPECPVEHPAESQLKAR